MKSSSGSPCVMCRTPTNLGCAKLQQLILASRTGEIDPADDAGDKIVLFRQAQHPPRFFEVVLCLHEDGLLNARILQVWQQVGGQVIAVDGRPQPTVVERFRELPKVLMHSRSSYQSARTPMDSNRFANRCMSPVCTVNT